MEKAKVKTIGIVAAILTLSVALTSVFVIEHFSVSNLKTGYSYSDGISPIKDGELDISLSERYVIGSISEGNKARFVSFDYYGNVETDWNETGLIIKKIQKDACGYNIEINTENYEMRSETLYSRACSFRLYAIGTDDTKTYQEQKQEAAERFASDYAANIARLSTYLSGSLSIDVDDYYVLVYGFTSGDSYDFMSKATAFSAETKKLYACEYDSSVASTSEYVKSDGLFGITDPSKLVFEGIPAIFHVQKIVSSSSSQSESAGSMASSETSSSQATSSEASSSQATSSSTSSQSSVEATHGVVGFITADKFESFFKTGAF